MIHDLYAYKKMVEAARSGDQLEFNRCAGIFDVAARHVIHDIINQHSFEMKIKAREKEQKQLLAKCKQFDGGTMYVLIHQSDVALLEHDLAFGTEYLEDVMEVASVTIQEKDNCPCGYVLYKVTNGSNPRLEKIKANYDTSD